MIAAFACGGEGRNFAELVRDSEALRDQVGVSYRFVETKCPEGIAPSRCIELRPDHLPTDVNGSFADLVAMTGLTRDQYATLRLLVSPTGLAQLPSMGFLATMREFSRIGDAIDADMRANAAARGGSANALVLTFASTCGGTGAAGSRVVGWAARLAARRSSLPADTRWVHVAVTTSILPDGVRARRVRALEHRYFLETRELMRPGAEVRLPGLYEPVRNPGPDEIVLVASSAEAPRTLPEAAHEFALVLRNLL